MNDVKDFVRFFYRLYNNKINYKDNNFKFKIEDEKNIINLQLSNPDNDIPSQLEFWIWYNNNTVTFELTKTRKITRKLYPNEKSFFQRVIETLYFMKKEKKVNPLNVLIPFQNPHLEQIADDEEEEEDDMDVISVNSKNSMTYTLQNESDSDNDVEILSESDDEIEIL